MERQVFSMLDALTASRDLPIPRQVAERIYNDLTAFVTAKSYLNNFEHFCVAMNSGSIDEDHAYKLHAGRVTHVQKYSRSSLMLYVCEEITQARTSSWTP
jgi:hypothetical protein